LPSLQNRPDRNWNPVSLLFNGYRVHFLGIKKPELKVDPSPSSSSKAENKWSYTSAVTIGLILKGEVVQIQLFLEFTFTIQRNVEH
jgi:hypothetical protein